MSPETIRILESMKPHKTVWCQHGQQPGSPMDEHQVCIDQAAAHRARGGTSWKCPCRCHR